MNALRSTLSAITISGLLAGCGGAGTTASVPPALTQNIAHHATSSSGDLLYVTTTKDIVMLSLPQGTIVGKIPWHANSLNNSICSDPTNGDVFIPEGTDASSANYIYEYAHGGTTPIATLDIPTGDQDPIGCAVDPNTHNLAVIALVRPGAGFLVYPGGSGSPVTYADSKAHGLLYAAYDDSDDLFSMTGDPHGGIKIAELRPGQTKFNFLHLVNCNGCSWSKLQWDGTYLAFSDAVDGQKGIGQLSLSRNAATLVNFIPLLDVSGRTDNFWINAGSVFAGYQKLRRHNNQGVGVWSYSSGENPVSKFYGLTKGPKDYIYDFTVSVAPMQSRIYK